MAKRNRRVNGLEITASTPVAILALVLLALILAGIGYVESLRPANIYTTTNPVPVEPAPTPIPAKPTACTCDEVPVRPAGAGWMQERA